MKGNIIIETRQTKIINQKQPITQKKDIINKKDKKEKKKKKKKNKYFHKPAEVNYYGDPCNSEYYIRIIYYLI